MPVNTRSQTKKMSAVKNIVDTTVPSTIEPSTFTPQLERDFVSDNKVRLTPREKTVGKTAKMRIALQTMNKANSSLLNIINDKNTLKWKGLVAAIYDKTFQLENELNANVYAEIDVNLVSKFTESYLKTRKLASEILKIKTREK